MNNNFNNGIRLKRDYFDVYDSSIATTLFVVLQNVFLVLYSLLPEGLRIISIVSMIASFLLEFTFALAGYLTARIRNVDFFKASKLNKKVNWKVALWCLLIAIICIFSFSSFSNVFIALLESAGYTPALSNMSIPNFGTYLFYLFMICVVPAVFEEICFRGTICAGLEKQNKHLAVFVSAFLFMIMHGGPEQTIHQFILGVIFGYIFVYTGNLWVTILIHFFNNAIAVTVMYIETISLSGVTSGDIQGEATEVALTPLTTIATLVIGIIMAVVACLLIKVIVEQINKQLNKIENQNSNNGDVLIAQQEITENTEQDNADNSSNNLVPVVEADKKQSVWKKVLMWAMFILPTLYMIFNWALELLAGFSR